MFEHLMENDVDRWRDDFLNALETWPTADDQAMAS
jgi:hypothetical protein